MIINNLQPLYMKPEIRISVIIPQRDSLNTLGKLLKSIPERDDIEVIVVDNTPMPVTKDDIAVDRNYTLLWSAPERHAGGARNVGMENANGQWLVFADADDYFADGAFDVFFSKIDSDVDIVYSCMRGVYLDSDEKCDRGKEWTALVRGYLDKSLTEEDLRLRFASPVCKMIRRELVERHNLKYDEIRAGNDVYFSISSGFLARRIDAVPDITYVVTLSKNSLTHIKSSEVLIARMYARLHCNEFLREHGFYNRQGSILFLLYKSLSFGLKPFFQCIALNVRFRQNPFVGISRMRKSYYKKKEQKERDKRLFFKGGSIN